MSCGVVIFPGSNCDHDVYHVLKHVLDLPVEFLFHSETSLRGCELVVLPGGFSYGDYLRAGAMAAASPIMAAVRRHADAGGLVLGICNGFQILLEAGLLPGAMRRNVGLRFLCQDVELSVERIDLPFTGEYRLGERIRMPIAHAEGSYVHTTEGLDELEAHRQVVFRYAADSSAPGGGNPNGAERAIAGICNRAGNVLGMMPHPERCAEPALGNVDGLRLFSGVIRPLVTAGEG